MCLGSRSKGLEVYIRSSAGAVQSTLGWLKVYWTFLASHSFHSCSCHELEISGATRPSNNTVGEPWTPFCLLNLTTRRNEFYVPRLHSGRPTGIFQIISDIVPAIRTRLEREVVQETVLGARADHRRREVSELCTDLEGRECRGGDVEVVSLLLEELCYFWKRELSA